MKIRQTHKNSRNNGCHEYDEEKEGDKAESEDLRDISGLKTICRYKTNQPTSQQTEKELGLQKQPDSPLGGITFLALPHP